MIQKARAIWGECFGIPRTSGASKRTLRIDAGAKRATTEKADKPPSEAAWKRKRSSAVTAGAQSAPKRTKTEVKEDAERISAPIWGASHQKKKQNTVRGLPQQADGAPPRKYLAWVCCPIVGGVKAGYLSSPLAGWYQPTPFLCAVCWLHSQPPRACAATSRSKVTNKNNAKGGARSH